MPAWHPTKLVKAPVDVEARLQEMNLNLAGLLRARDVALAGASNATDFHCLNAAGQYAYQDGTAALRREFVGPDWRIDRLNGVEGIFNDKLNTRIAFCNVHLACDEEEAPEPRSGKGPGAERACQGNLFGHLPHYTKEDDAPCATFYLMVDRDGACELSRPRIADKTFESFVERIYLSDGSDFREPAKLSLTADDAMKDFDPQIVRKG